MLLLPLPYGTWFVSRLRHWEGQSNTMSIGFTITWLLGLSLLTALLEVWSLFGPLQLLAFAAAAVGSIVLASLDLEAFRQVVARARKQLQQMPLLIKLVLAVIGFGLCAFATVRSINGDTAVYHAQAIRWLEEAGAVPGLANVETRIGYNPSWFVPEVLASWGRWLGSPLQTLNALLLFVYSAYALGAVGEFRSIVCASAMLRLLLLPLLLFWCLDDVASLSPDPAVTTLVFVVLSQAVALPIPSRLQSFGAVHAALTLLAFFAVTVKMSAIALLLLPIVWVWRNVSRQTWQWLLKLAGAAAIIIAPWLLRNVIITGYLLFPFPALDLFDFDWKLDRAELYEHVEYIRNFARV